MSFPAPFDYSGPPEMQPVLAAALRRVVDPEMALNVVDLGLIYGVEATEGAVKVRLTMTSAACPVAELIMDDVVDELTDLLGTDVKVEPELVWDPPWTPERMSHQGRMAMGWD